MADYIPPSDSVFLLWEQNFVGFAMTNLATLGLLPADGTALTGARANFETSLTEHTTAAAHAQAMRQTKDQNREIFEQVIRSLVRRIQANPDVTDLHREMLGITVKDQIRTMAAGSLDGRPVGMIDTAERLRHTIRFVDEATPTRKAKPSGVMGCEIWAAITTQGQPAPAEPSDYQFVALDTATPYLVEYEGSHAGKIAHYLLRWIKTSGEKGPWSETVSATIVG